MHKIYLGRVLVLSDVSLVNPFNSRQHTTNADVIAVVIWEKSSSRRQKNAVARVLRFSKKDFFLRIQIGT